MARVVLRQLSKTYPEKSGPGMAAVRGVDLIVEDREFMVLVGPSGCGKSTLLRMIAGLEEISGGTVTIGDRVVNDVPPKDRDIAMVFQNYALYPHMSVRDNLAFGLKLRGLPRPEIDARVRDAAEMLQIGHLLDRRPKALSGGQRQRVAVGRAIVRQPAVFLFDEPLSNLDAKMRVTTRVELAKLHARLAATMIYVTHDQVEAMTLGDRICVMHDGRIRQVATPLELYRHPADVFVAGFIGSPAMNLLPGRIERERHAIMFSAPWGRVALPASPGYAALGAGQAVLLGLRPEHVTTGAIATGDAPRYSGVVEVAEAMGAETHLHVALDGATLIARVAPAAAARPGERVSLAFDLEHASLFDAASEAAIPR